MGLRSLWRSVQRRGNEDDVEWAEDAQQDTADEVAHQDIDEVRLDMGTSRLGESMDDGRRYE